MRKDIAKLWKLAEPVVDDAGLELVELQFERDQGGHVLRVYIDFPPQADGPSLPLDAASPGASLIDQGLVPEPEARHVGLDECERVSRDLSAALDVADAIPFAYRLEVSSPGIDRPLRRETDFVRFRGASARIRTADPVEGRRNFNGTLRDVENGIVLIECDGQSYPVPIANIAKANLVPDWDAEFRRHRRAGAATATSNGRRAS